jgi:two-component system, NtrC family, response regulator AtoC
LILRALVDVEPVPLQQRLEGLLEQCGVLLTGGATRHRDLWQRLSSEDVDLVLLTPSRLPSPAARLVASVRQLPDAPEVIVVVGDEDAERRSEMLAAGCLAVLYDGVSDAILLETLRSLVERRRQDGLRRLKADRPEERFSLNDFVLASPAMQRFVAVARRVVAADSSLLILGETGVGKERLARAIHAESPRGRGPFVAVNCGALPEGLLESELFGHERGAFTGAVASRKGHFELAHEGTIFLDEIGDLPLHLQVKLLRALEERRLQRVGGQRPIAVDVRVMAATNRDLEAEMAAGRFRTDLYYRLAVVTLTLPALRERWEDIPDLAESYLQHFRLLLGRPVRGIREEAMAALVGYPWPGNVRELINVMEQTVLLCPGSEIELSDLPRRITGSTRLEDRRSLAAVAAASGDLDPHWLEKTLPDAKREVAEAFERTYLTLLLRSTKGRVGEAARRAGITPRFLYDRMRRHGLRKEAYRVAS